MARRAKSEDLLDLAFVSDPQLSPDGLSAACVVTRIVKGSLGEDGAGEGHKGDNRTDGKDDYRPPRYQSRIHLFDLEEPRSAAGRGGKRLPRRPSEGKAFTLSEYSDTSPRFSPDNRRLAFTSVRKEGDKPQLHVIALGGGEAVKITAMKAGVGEFAWHPDAARIAFVSRGVYRDAAAERGLPRRVRRRYFRADGGGHRPEEPAQVYLVAADGGDSEKLTDLEFSPRSLLFSPTGDALYLLAPGDEEADSSFAADILRIDLKSKAVTKVLEGLVFGGNLGISPSGRWLSFTAPANLSGDRPDLASPSGLWLLDLKATSGGKRSKAQPRLLSDPDLDVLPSLGGDSRYGSMPDAPIWSQREDGSEGLVINRFVNGRSDLARLGLQGEFEPFESEHDAVTSFGGRAGLARYVFTAEASDRPGELYVRYEDGREERLSGINDAWRKRLRLTAAAGPFPLPARKGGKSGARAKGADLQGRERVQYWTITAPNPRPDKAAVLEVHGGPHTAYGNGFYFEFQLLAARGYSVIFGNPRGGSSYGYAFATSLLGRYGSVDADDVVDIGEAGLAALGDAKAPLHLTGGSYGGFMTNWLITQTDRYRSAVTQRSISNWTSMYGTSDIGPRFVEREIGGIPWTDVDKLWQQSPIKHVAKVKTPLLIEHSEDDFRCPIEQAEQFFTALKRLGTVEVEFVRTPGEGHELSRSGRPDRRVARLDAIVAWFEAHP